jgi:hypothetical protein
MFSGYFVTTPPTVQLSENAFMEFPMDFFKLKEFVF